ncbi:2-C-methyl-D-erythritol 2,4-cyclodiphosphate synthase [Acetobacteraceae bacterium]|nr:2-C-methyl-D-erythritol 2,4-cyclodiphosphate synthase [Acetobacteraceae bacterium]
MTSAPPALPSKPYIAAILLGGGTGKRFKESLKSPLNTENASLPKQYLLLNGKPIIHHAAEALLPYVDLIQPVGDREKLVATLPKDKKILPPVSGGTERQDSVRNGLEALSRLSKTPDLVLIHDGARPLVPSACIENVLEALNDYYGAIPARKVTDTIKRVENDVIVATVERDNLRRAQTPQGFHFQLFLDLHRKDNNNKCTDDIALLEAAGFETKVVEGSERNIKVTVEEDLNFLKTMFSQTSSPAPLLPHIGNGYDVHAFEAGRPLMLGGVEVPHTHGLAGHSDADVVLHALCDALYGAMNEGDIGRHFPPSDNQWKSANSRQFLEHAIDFLRQKNGRLINADITLICEAPKISPHAEKMMQKMAEIMDVSPKRISLKATTTEKLGFTGRKEGIACFATVSVLLPDIEEN